MNLDKYKVTSGKLSRKIQFNVSEEFYSVFEKAKARNFDFNAWARDSLAAKLTELKNYLDGPDLR